MSFFNPPAWRNQARLPGGCDGTMSCWSHGTHLTGCPQLAKKLVAFKEDRRWFDAGKRRAS